MADDLSHLGGSSVLHFPPVMVARGIPVTVLPHESVRGGHGVDQEEQIVGTDGSPVTWYERIPLSDALERRWTTDAHVQLVQLAGASSAAVSAPRINKALLPALRAAGDEIQLRLLFVDYDNANHQPHADRDAAEALVLQLLSRSDYPAVVAYATRSGARAGYVLRDPVSVEDGERILRTLVGFVGGDSAATDWGRLFRLPNVLRDDLQTGDQDYFVMKWNDNAEFLDTAELLREAELSGARPATLQTTTRRSLPSIPPSIYSLPLSFPNPVPRGLRNTLFFRVACLWRSLGGDSEGIITHLKSVRDRYCVEGFDHPVSDAEIQSIARSACTYPQGQQRYEFTDIGNSKRFADDHRTEAFFCDETKCWYVWMGTHWERDLSSARVQQLATATVREISRQAAVMNASRQNGSDAEQEERVGGLAKALQGWAKNSSTRAKISAMVDLARGLLIRRVKDLDQDLWLLNFQNGTVDLRTGELREHDPEDLITRVIDYDFDPDADAPLFRETLEKVQPSAEMRDYLQRALGYSATGDISEQCFFLNVGGGANGKSTILGAVLHALGPYATAADIETFLHKAGAGSSGHNEATANLRGKRLVSASEPDAGRRWSERTLKELTGGESITASRKHEHEITFKVTCALWFSANHRPMIKGNDHGIWRRVRLIPWDYTVPKGEQDRRLATKLEAEAAGILAWLVAGCLAWQKEGLGDVPAIEAATDEYRSENNPVARFIEDCCEVEPGKSCTFQELHRRYEAWCSESGEGEPFTPKAFSQAVQQVLPGVKAGVRVNQKRGFRGLALRPSSDGGLRAQISRAPAGRLLARRGAAKIPPAQAKDIEKRPYEGLFAELLKREDGSDR